MTDPTDASGGPSADDDLVRRSEVVRRAGVLMLGAGTSGLRVCEVMGAVASTLGIDHLSAQVTSTDIVLTVGRGGRYRTLVGEIGSPGVNAHRIELKGESMRRKRGPKGPNEIP